MKWVAEALPAQWTGPRDWALQDDQNTNITRGNAAMNIREPLSAVGATCFRRNSTGQFVSQRP
jgi:hypothetical protein